ncbi:amino acid ABC transporter permease [Secundilactobacillus kimchicus]|uniref:amino acid ABC transporter permease n=1 Tax=Secundilactobacillus kimchicus TaxID=528209 RepID=UPI0034E4999C
MKKFFYLISGIYGQWFLKLFFLSLLILLLSIILGTGLTLLRQSQNRLTRIIYRIYISYFRGVPLLIHLLVFYYALPPIVKLFSDHLNLHVDTLHLNPIYAVLISYTLYAASFLSEIIRSSFKSVGKDQLEAAAALGYTKYQQFFAIKLPQALTDAIPKILNYYTLLIRQLSLAFLVSVVDIFAKSKLESADNFYYIESFLAAALVYWILCIALTLLFSNYEKYLRRFERSNAA